MIFLRKFYSYDDKAVQRVNMKHKWVWLVHVASYAYIFYTYFFTDSKKKESS